MEAVFLQQIYHFRTYAPKPGFSNPLKIITRYLRKNPVSSLNMRKPDFIIFKPLSGNFNNKFRSLTRCRITSEPSPVFFFDNRPGNRQTQSRSLTDSFCSK